MTISKNGYGEYRLSQYFTKHVENNSGTKYLVDVPPPTLSGDLHIGHLFSYTQTNAIIRYHGMQGKKLIVPLGVDNNGIPTWKLIINETHKDNFHARHKELETIDQKHGITSKYIEKYKQIFDKANLFYQSKYQYTTLDPWIKKMSQQIFLKLYKQGDIYYREWPVNWDTINNTAVSNMEIISLQKKSEMHYIKFGFLEKEDQIHTNVANINQDTDIDAKEIIIATTRPELLPACVAVLYNPKAYNAKFLEGKKIKVPLFNTSVPLLADEKVDLEKGTGYVMCCTFGDHNDVYWWNKFKLPLKQIIRKDGLINISEYYQDLYPELNGLTIVKARKQMIEILSANNHLIRSETIEHTVHCSERSNQPIEILNLPQWYLKTIKYQAEILNAANQINWIPSHMKKKLESWVQNLNSDWCISRQRQWGIRIPMYHNQKGEVVIPDEADLPLDNEVANNHNNLILDESILDTWFTSSLTPYIVSILAKEKIDKNMDAYNNYLLDDETSNEFFTTDFRFHAHEIIRTWTFGSILIAHLLNNQKTPWRNLIIGGWCKANDGAKFSKSKGNAPNLDELIDTHGIDTIKYWAFKAKIGNDVNLSDDMLANGKKFVHKIINAANFVLQNVHLIDEGQKGSLNKIEKYASLITHETDLCLLNKLVITHNALTAYMEKFETFEAFSLLETLFKSDFCDYYLEIIKKRFYNSEDIKGRISCSAACMLFHTVFLKWLFPFMPKLSEWLYCEIEMNQGAITQDLYFWPNLDRIKDLTSKEKDLSDVFEVIKLVMENVRKFKTHNKLSMNSAINSIKINCKINLKTEVLIDIKNSTQTNELKFELSDQNAIEVS